MNDIIQGMHVKTNYGSGTIQYEQDTGKYSPDRRFAVLMDELNPKYIEKGKEPILYFFLKDIKMIDYNQGELFT
jgi:hypothetical protein